jgi:hypothetical protein
MTTKWQPGAVPTQDPATGGWGFIATPQPGTFDATPATANQVTFNSKSLSDSPPAATVTTVPVNLPQAENAKRSVNVSGVFGTVKNPA